MTCHWCPFPGCDGCKYQGGRLARYEVRDMHAWTHTGLGYRTAPVRIEATSDPDVVTVAGERYEVAEVES